MYHANLLKSYDVEFGSTKPQLGMSFLPTVMRRMLMNLPFSLFETELYETADELPITLDSRVDQKALITVPEVSETLTTIQHGDLIHHINDFSNIFFEIPGCTSSLKHDIEVCTTECVRSSLCALPFHRNPFFQKEVKLMLSQRVMKLSMSLHCSKVAMVKKASDNYSLVLAYRFLTQLQCFPRSQ